MADCIAAISTALLPSGIGVIRLSGDGAADIAGTVFTARSGVPLKATPNRKLVLGTLHDRQGRVIDQILAVHTRGPHSYTGEDTVELQCHGSPAVLTEALSALFAAGARQAGPGEFTKRAFLNGRMDLTAAEAVIDLIEAETADAAANAAGQVGGALQKKLQPVYDALTGILSHFHAVLDYPDEDISPFSLHAYESTLAEAEEALNRLLATCQRGQLVKSGLTAVILGRPNAGKSSLLNALTGYDRVIVTDIPGTTRDTVEEKVRLGGVLLRLLDTAGIRDTADTVEQLGVDRARAAAAEAELALLVIDGSAPLSPEDSQAMEAATGAKQVLCVVTKSDLPQQVELSRLTGAYGAVFPVSAVTGAGLARLEDAVRDRFGGGDAIDGSLLTNARHISAVTRALDGLRRASASLAEGTTPDAVLVDVEDALEALGELTGRVVREDVTNGIFSRFCVGK